jgi:hypothetical protein
MASKRQPLIPSADTPVPYNLSDEPVPHLISDAMRISAQTAEALEALGATVEVDASTLKEEQELFEEAILNKKTEAFLRLPSAHAAAAFLSTYASSHALDVAAIRSALTNKLLTLADCGDPKFELRAIELLGKHSDIGLFTERSEVRVTHQTSLSLEEAIHARVQRLLLADNPYHPPLGINLADEIGEWVEVDPDEPPDAE